MDRIIFHADCNNFFASCEILRRPELRDVPMAVAGDPDQRLGVVVAKNEAAKRYGVKTTDTVFQARQKCPDIVFVPPQHRYYAEISRRVNQIYLEYTDLVEPASIDESYIDMTLPLRALKCTPRALADELRARVKGEIGITISVGVSDCKIFAKMGSDYQKPDATTFITRENYRALLWPLPVSELFMAGKAAVGALEKRCIHTIGDLASQEPSAMRSLLGRQGELLWRYANGIDPDPVRPFDEKRKIKSVSRGRTFRRDLVAPEEVRTALTVLSDEVARDLRRHQLKGQVVTVQIKKPDMTTLQRQTKLERPTFLQREIQAVAFGLMEANWFSGDPIRALTVGVSKLAPADEIVEQVTLFDAMPAPGPRAGHEQRQRQEALEKLMDEVRHRYGESSLTLGYQENKDIGIVRGDQRRD